jgi:hypothetical protein
MALNMTALYDDLHVILFGRYSKEIKTAASYLIKAMERGREPMRRGEYRNGGDRY